MRASTEQAKAQKSCSCCSACASGSNERVRNQQPHHPKDPFRFRSRSAPRALRPDEPISPGFPARFRLVAQRGAFGGSLQEIQAGRRPDPDLLGEGVLWVSQRDGSVTKHYTIPTICPKHLDSTRNAQKIGTDSRRLRGPKHSQICARPQRIRGKKLACLRGVLPP